MTAITKAAALAWAAAISAPALAGGVGPGTGGGAETSPCVSGGTCRTGLSAADLLELADRYAAADRLDEAERLLEALSRDPERQVRAEALFRLGNVRANRGNLRSAANAYRAVLDEDPKAARVRLELARVLYAGGDEEGARRQLLRAEASGLPDDVARLVNRFAGALRSRRPYGGSVEFGFAPDTNINRASASDAVEIGSLPFELDEDAQARSGVGAIVAAQGFWRMPIAADANLLVRASTQANLYRHKQFNDVSASLLVGPELLLGRSRVRPAALATRRWFGNEFYSESGGATVNVQAPLGTRTQLEADATVQYANYRTNQALDGWQFSLSPRLEHALTQTLYARVGLRVDRSEARDVPYRSWTYGGDALLSQDLGKETVFGRAAYYRTVGDGPFAIAPARNDKQLELQGGIMSRRFRINGLLPGARVSYTDNDSPVFFYDYRRTRFELFLSKEL